MDKTVGERVRRYREKRRGVQVPVGEGHSGPTLPGLPVLMRMYRDLEKRVKALEDARVPETVVELVMQGRRR